MHKVTAIEHSDLDGHHNNTKIKYCIIIRIFADIKFEGISRSISRIELNFYQIAWRVHIVQFVVVIALLSLKLFPEESLT